jgi:hypothetical protein
MFNNAVAKLEDSRYILEQLKIANDFLAFRSLFNSFLNAARAITYALQKEGKHISGFNNWYEPRRKQMRNDELLRFIHEARIEDFHEGKQILKSGTHIRYLSREAVGPPPSPDARLVVGSQGPLWIVNEGTPQEQRIPVKQGADHVIWIYINKNAPEVHLGVKLAKNDPVTICQLALDYFTGLVYEAKSEFASQEQSSIAPDAAS